MRTFRKWQAMPHILVGAIGAGFAFTCPAWNFQLGATGLQARFARTTFNDVHCVILGRLYHISALKHAEAFSSKSASSSYSCKQEITIGFDAKADERNGTFKNRRWAPIRRAERPQTI